MLHCPHDQSYWQTNFPACLPAQMQLHRSQWQACSVLRYNILVELCENDMINHYLTNQFVTQIKCYSIKLSFNCFHRIYQLIIQSKKPYQQSEIHEWCNLTTFQNGYHFQVKLKLHLKMHLIHSILPNQTFHPFSKTPFDSSLSTPFKPSNHSLHPSNHSTTHSRRIGRWKVHKGHKVSLIYLSLFCLE